MSTANEDEDDDQVSVAAAKVFAQHQTIRQIVRSVRLVAAIAVSYLPLQPLRDSIVALAGEATEVSAVLDLTVYVGLTLTATLGGAGWKVYAQRRELKKLRKRVDDLENENVRLRGALSVSTEDS